MAVRCSAKQVAEVVSLRSSHNGPHRIFCIEIEDMKDLKCLDLFYSTIDVFSDAFFKVIKHSFVEHKETFLSKQNFIEYLKPRAVLLTEENGHFNFMLTCSYFSVLLKTCAFSRNCFHFARVACRLLTSILEDRFTEIFETDDGWENLMSYCKKIHIAVFPSKSNRPFGYKPHFKSRSSYDEDGNKELCTSIILESSEKTYWNYFVLERNTICERITDNRQHLKDVYRLLVRFGQDMAMNKISSDKYDISISDDEYLEQLERETATREVELFLPKAVKDCFAKKICENANKRLESNSRSNKFRPEDVNIDKATIHIGNLFVDENVSYPKCEKCKGRMPAFIKNWEKSFYERYSNSGIVTEGLSS